MNRLSPNELAAYRRRGVAIRVASRSDVGLVRTNNEDALVSADFCSGGTVADGALGPAGVLFGVCDGMGGAAAGEVASRLAATVVAQELARVPAVALADDFVDAVRAAVQAAGDAVRIHARRNVAHKGMGTTCTIAAVRGALMTVAHVGDSRAYLLRSGRLQQLTRDQTWANEMLAEGRVTEDELDDLEHGRAIVQAVGTTEKLEVECLAVELCRGDIVLICSDGLSNMVPDEVLASALGAGSDLEQVSDELVRRALEGGARDNLSFVVTSFEGLAARGADEAADDLALAGASWFGSRWNARAVAAVAAVLAIVCAGGLCDVFGTPANSESPRSSAAGPIRKTPTPAPAESASRSQSASSSGVAEAFRAVNADTLQDAGADVEAVRHQVVVAPRGDSRAAPLKGVGRRSDSGGAKNNSPADAIEIQRPSESGNPF